LNARLYNYCLAIKLRDYQQALVDEIRAAAKGGHRKVLAVLPTGGGKSQIIGSMVAGATDKGCRTLVLAHRSRLIRQLSGTTATWDVPHGVIAAGSSVDNDFLTQVASVQSVIRRLDVMASPDLIVVDEAHHLLPNNMWGRVLGCWPDALVVGLTATPIRSDGRGLGQAFTAMVWGPSTAELTSMGYLAPARVFCPPVGFDPRGIRRVRGDYDQVEASERLTVSQVLGDAVAHYERFLAGAPLLCFCSNVRHAELQAAAYRAAGVRAASVDGRTPEEEQDRILADLGTGALQVVTSCDLIGEGVDVPAVAGCQFLRVTASEALHLQMMGRALRLAPGKERAVMLDHVGNVRRLGDHLEEREWTLEGVRRRERDGAAAISVRECPECFAANRGGVKICDECGHVFLIPTATVQTVEGQLEELLMEQRARKRAQGQARTMKELIELGRQRGMKNPYGWARHVARARHNR